jgi:hypothetical protein
MTPKKAFRLLGDNPNHPDKNKLEILIAQSAKYSYLHAFYMGIRFVEGESAIAKDSFYSSCYSRKMRVRFVEGEEAISRGVDGFDFFSL